MSTLLLSIVTPVFNEALNLREYMRRVQGVADQLREQDIDVEVVLVDDRSSDESPRIVEEFVNTIPRVLSIRLARNCGSHSALAAGLSHCNGDCAVLMAADLQDPPETILEFVTLWKQGFDVVWAARLKREGETLSTRFLARVYYWVMRRLGLPEMPEGGADFVLIDRKVISVYTRVPEKNTSIMGMLMWLGFRQTAIGYVKESRHAGEGKWTLSKKLKLFVDSVVSFSYVPVRLMSVSGAMISSLGFLYAIVVVANAFRGESVQGWSSLIVVLLILGGFQLLMLGILGEYIWRTFDEVRGRPRFIVEKVLASSNDLRVAGAGPTGSPGGRASEPPTGPAPAIQLVDTRLDENGLVGATSERHL